MSAVVPGFTSDAADRDVTDPMRCSNGGCASEMFCVVSAWTVTPFSAYASWLGLAATVTEYVSGLSETNENLPLLSVVAVADCDGLSAVT
jgi:hypothetical protein